VQNHLLDIRHQLNERQQQHEQLQHQVDLLQGRVDQTSQTSNKPPSSDSPYKKPTRRQSSGKRGGRKGHAGSGPILLAPTEGQHVYPASCACSQGELVAPTLYQTHQVIELPPIAMQSPPVLLHQARCVGCGQRLKAEVPAHQATGYGPRLTALIAELTGMQGTSRRLIQDCCHSVLPIPISLGAIQKVLDRTSHALLPHDEAIAQVARPAPVGDIDETPWYCQHTLQWLWTMATDTVSLSLIHPNRSTDAFFALIDDWRGLLVSDGDGVYQNWGHRRQTC
jgi:transposase